MPGLGFTRLQLEPKNRVGGSGGGSGVGTVAGPHHTCTRRSAWISIQVFLSISTNSIQKRWTPPCSYGCASRALCWLSIPARSGVLLLRPPCGSCRWGHHQQLTPTFDTYSLGEEQYASFCCCRGFSLVVLATTSAFFRGAEFVWCSMLAFAVVVFGAAHGCMGVSSACGPLCRFAVGAWTNLCPLVVAAMCEPPCGTALAVRVEPCRACTCRSPWALAFYAGLWFVSMGFLNF